MTMFHARYDVTITSIAHGTFKVRTAASSALQARNQVMDFEGCPPSCITKIDRVRVLMPVAQGLRPSDVIHLSA